MVSVSPTDADFQCLRFLRWQNKKLKCSAIPETVFDEKYLENWKNWNNVTLDNQITKGIKEMYSQCIDQAPTEKAKEHLKNHYKKIKHNLYF